MLHKPLASEQQGVRDLLTEGVTTLSALQMNQVLQNCGYEHQRAISERHVLVLADLMRRDRWQPKSQIDFAVVNGEYIMVNGYHRAYAQVRSGKTITWSIALHKVNSEKDLRSLYYAFDTNLRARSSRDILRAAEFGDMTGITGEMADSLYRAVPYLASKFASNPKHKNFLVANQVDRRLELAAEYAKAAGKFATAIDGMPAGRRPKFRSGAIVAVAVATFRYQEQTAWEFWHGVAYNDGLKRGDPRLALVTDLMTRKAINGTADAYAPSIIAWNAYFNEKSLSLIKVLDSFVPVIDGTPFDGKPVKVA